ncbi:hypothetical protein TFKS16_0502 [Tannerella forsythia KS16]|uniref:Uncharacterized protein n=1 Tax=Tannerella forsythia (strain ATCC 43037 / JCM 10827 / CCUG 21028 A / KCTC 5666 / FDC 338) TaxID=203275 RepID=G8UKJ0_TANFA|nr:hypothetical protein BFO_0436 [Tannerella forsythia 92A2]BAR47964.1 hypothetical protein TF3313_0375 [Tannerella forsythia 3313]BAR50813.1 hypothetical protein TFKS16_0502 [Tannerella forsythia KS16]
MAMIKNVFFLISFSSEFIRKTIYSGDKDKKVRPLTIGQ